MAPIAFLPLAHHLYDIPARPSSLRRGHMLRMVSTARQAHPNSGKTKDQEGHHPTFLIRGSHKLLFSNRISLDLTQMGDECLRPLRMQTPLLDHLRNRTNNPLLKTNLFDRHLQMHSRCQISHVWLLKCKERLLRQIPCPLTVDLQ